VIDEIDRRGEVLLGLLFVLQDEHPIADRDARREGDLVRDLPATARFAHGDDGTRQQFTSSFLRLRTQRQGTGADLRELFGDSNRGSARNGRASVAPRSAYLPAG